MARDSLFGERILWSGRVKAARVPLPFRVIAAVSGVVSLVTLLYAIVVSRSLHVPVGGMVVFAAWCAALAVGAWRGPLHWRSKVEYFVTDKHVIWRRGRLRRTIERGQISYALVRWDRRDPTMGDLVLVRAVPTGALRRTLSLTLSDVEAPDRLWALVRGVSPSEALGNGDRPLAQRLDEGERVLWSAIPLASPWTLRRGAMAVTGLLLATVFVHSLVRIAPGIVKLLKAHALPPSLLAVLVAAAALGSLVLLAVAVGVGHAALVRPGQLARQTRYFVTSERVLIRRGREELHLDRSRIAYVIDAPSRGLHDVFLVLDGPQARALATSGAFGGDDAGVLRPVFSKIVDAESVHQILSAKPLRRAA